jgi:hypothetical protein
MQHTHIVFFTIFYTHTPHNYMFTNHQTSKFNNNLNTHIKHLKFEKSIF